MSSESVDSDDSLFGGLGVKVKKEKVEEPPTLATPPTMFYEPRIYTDLEDDLPRQRYLRQLRCECIYEDTKEVFTRGIAEVEAALENLDQPNSKKKFHAIRKAIQSLDKLRRAVLVPQEKAHEEYIMRYARLMGTVAKHRFELEGDIAIANDRPSTALELKAPRKK